VAAIIGWNYLASYLDILGINDNPLLSHCYLILENDANLFCQR